jgi:hypothetical protein
MGCAGASGATCTSCSDAQESGVAPSATRSRSPDESTTSPANFRLRTSSIREKMSLSLPSPSTALSPDALPMDPPPEEVNITTAEERYVAGW